MIQKRAVTETDEVFLFQLYSSTRLDELAAWGWDEVMQQQFLQLQWRAQKHSYAMQYPDAEHILLCYQNIPIGRIIVARSDTAVILVDITILPDYRGMGIGTTLIRELQNEAAASLHPLLLSVLPTNRAMQLYERLGFRAIGSLGLHISMEWTPTPSGEGTF
ncbi:GNAT family N-acetyltransferase [Brevibacillus ruminantium]|uniref:GNAT family N-acetyltransferase n=1 Tax=Brevibacillus ruminantium TaxID=2950604 RepID=A0ABY4WD06_9BACL|nr:GNAT family N-acetyltransferase [Brevibacillus ruminantium]USG65060.1 GNAT family N-acetyltransferase [Brevibacillus ruminantium]